MLEQAFDGSPESLGPAVGAMYGLKAQAQSLMETPAADGPWTAGPTFEYVPRDRRQQPSTVSGQRPFE
jgi:hypothetical protein